jgi:hypothetical protein
MDAGWRKDLGEAVQKLESGETQRGSTGGIGTREKVEDLVGAAADEVEAVEGEGRPGTIADEALQAGAVGGLGPAASVALRLGAGSRPGRRCRPPGLWVSCTDLCGHRRPLASRETIRCVSTSRERGCWGRKNGR